MLQRRAAPLQLGVLHLCLRYYTVGTYLSVPAAAVYTAADLNLGTPPDPAGCRPLCFVSVLSVPRLPLWQPAPNCDPIDRLPRVGTT
jgi:hypothetical protein